MFIGGVFPSRDNGASVLLRFCYTQRGYLPNLAISCLSQKRGGCHTRFTVAEQSEAAS